MKLLLMSVVAGASIAADVGADVVNLGSVKDNTVYQDPNGALSNGAGEFFFAGNNANNLIRRGVIAFDLSAIPAGSTINNVSLTLHMSQTSTGAQNVSLHSLLSNWGQGTSDASGGEGGGAPSTPGDATWIHSSYNTQFWTNAGGDFIASPSATLSVDAIGFYTWNSAQMIADVQQWLKSPGTNFGWMLRGNEAAANTAKRFDTRENAISDFRPVLTIDYTPVPSPSALAVMVVGLLAGARKPRR